MRDSSPLHGWFLCQLDKQWLQGIMVGVVRGWVWDSMGAGDPWHSWARLLGRGEAGSASSLISAPPSGTSESKHTGILEEDETIKERRVESSTTHSSKQATSSGCLGHPDPWTWGKKTGLK